MAVVQARESGDSFSRLGRKRRFCFAWNMVLHTESVNDPDQEQGLDDGKGACIRGTFILAILFC